MAADTDDAGFLSRWSRRKAMVRQGTVPVESLPPVPEAAPAASPPTALPSPHGQATPAAADTAPAAAETPPKAPPPTLADVATLTRDSDYSRFVGRGVQPEVRNAALGKLFTDPHFNIMDGLDTYIDDYGKPDPLPESMLRKMLQAQAMGLFDDEDKDKSTAQPVRPAAAAPPPPDLATDENTDLQLQPDDDAGRAGAEPGAGEDAGRAH